MEHANPFAIFFILCVTIPVLGLIVRAKRGKSFFIRRIPGIDAIDETVGRSIELGRSLSFTSGLISIGPLFYACLGVLRYIAQKTAMFGSKLFVPCYDPEVMILSDSAIQGAYRQERKFSQYDPSTVRFLSSNQFAYASGYMGLIHREHVGGAFLFGSFAAESLILAEAGQQIGSMQVAATTSNEQIPFFITACDYTLIGEELYAAGAYLSKNPIQTGSLRAQDFIKLGLIILIVIGIIQSTYFAFSGESSPWQLERLLTASWGELFKN